MKLKDTLAVRSLQRFARNRAALVSLIFLIIFAIVCYFPALLTKYSQNEQDRTRRRLSPSSEHWLGTDILGRDLLSEVLHAGQISLRIAIAVGILTTIVGVTIGAIAGYYGGWIDSLLMRATDMFLVLPQLVVLIIALQRFGGTDYAMVLIISAISWMYTARLVRSEILSLKDREFIQAARISGKSGFYIIFRHLIPNAYSVIAVSIAFTIAGAILLESVVSFLGYGIQKPQTSWGQMIYDLKEYTVGPYFYMFLAPAVSIFITVLAFNFVSDGLRDALDPRSEQS